MGLGLGRQRARQPGLRRRAPVGRSAESKGRRRRRACCLPQPWRTHQRTFVAGKHPRRCLHGCSNNTVPAWYPCLVSAGDGQGGAGGGRSGLSPAWAVGQGRRHPDGRHQRAGGGAAAAGGLAEAVGGDDREGGGAGWREGGLLEGGSGSGEGRMLLLCALAGSSLCADDSACSNANVGPHCPSPPCLQLGSHPLFQRMRGLTGGLADAKMFERGREVRESLRERWETSDSPLVHRIQVGGWRRRHIPRQGLGRGHHARVGGWVEAWVEAAQAHAEGLVWCTMRLVSRPYRPTLPCPAPRTPPTACSRRASRRGRCARSGPVTLPLTWSISCATCARTCRSSSRWGIESLWGWVGGRPAGRLWRRVWAPMGRGQGVWAQPPSQWVGDGPVAATGQAAVHIWGGGHAKQPGRVLHRHSDTGGPGGWLVGPQQLPHSVLVRAASLGHRPTWRDRRT